MLSGPASVSGVILSEERSDESKDPYFTHTLRVIKGYFDSPAQNRGRLAQHDTQEWKL
jgi:hypothetical protein